MGPGVGWANGGGGGGCGWVGWSGGALVVTRARASLVTHFSVSFLPLLPPTPPAQLHRSPPTECERGARAGPSRHGRPHLTASPPQETERGREGVCVCVCVCVSPRRARSRQPRGGLHSRSPASALLRSHSLPPLACAGSSGAAGASPHPHPPHPHPSGPFAAATTTTAAAMAMAMALACARHDRADAHPRSPPCPLLALTVGASLVDSCCCWCWLFLLPRPRHMCERGCASPTDVSGCSSVWKSVRFGS